MSRNLYHILVRQPSGSDRITNNPENWTTERGVGQKLTRMIGGFAWLCRHFRPNTPDACQFN